MSRLNPNSHAIPELPDLEYLQRELIRSDTSLPYVCLKFKAEWCGPCKRVDMGAVLQSNPNIQWFEVDADHHSDVLDYCNISTIPAFLAIKQGVPQRVFQSSKTEDIVAWLRQTFP